MSKRAARVIEVAGNALGSFIAGYKRKHAAPLNAAELLETGLEIAEQLPAPLRRPVMNGMLAEYCANIGAELGAKMAKQRAAATSVAEPEASPAHREGPPGARRSPNG